MATALEPKQKLIAAYAHLCRNVPQDVLASIMEVNQARINEAVQAARVAFEIPQLKKDRSATSHLDDDEFEQ